MKYISAWEDEFYTYTGSTEFVYFLYNDADELLYTGKAVARPDDAIRINISALVRSYLNSDLASSAFGNNGFNVGTTTMPNSVKEFYITDEEDTVLETYVYLNCYDYITSFALIAGSGLDVPLSNPVNNHSVVGMYSFTSLYSKTNNNVKTTIGNVLVTDTGWCGKAALYYSNAKGGWDSFLIEGNITKTDTYDKYSISSNWETKTLQSGNRTLMNTITESWQLMTHMLKDSEMDKLASNLFSSNNIYFHNLVTDTIVPVKITDTSVVYKTWQNNKRKKFYATIKIESNQPKKRI